MESQTERTRLINEYARTCAQIGEAHYQIRSLSGKITQWSQEVDIIQQKLEKMPPEAPSKPALNIVKLEEVESGKEPEPAAQ